MSMSRSTLQIPIQTQWNLPFLSPPTDVIILIIIVVVVLAASISGSRSPLLLELDRGETAPRDLIGGNVPLKPSLS